MNYNEMIAKVAADIKNPTVKEAGIRDVLADVTGKARGYANDALLDGRVIADAAASRVRGVASDATSRVRGVASDAAGRVGEFAGNVADDFTGRTVRNLDEAADGHRAARRSAAQEAGVYQTDVNTAKQYYDEANDLLENGVGELGGVNRVELGRQRKNYAANIEGSEGLRDRALNEYGRASEELYQADALVEEAVKRRNALRAAAGIGVAGSAGLAGAGLAGAGAVGAAGLGTAGMLGLGAAGLGAVGLGAAGMNAMSNRGDFEERVAFEEMDAIQKAASDILEEISLTDSTSAELGLSDIERSTEKTASDIEENVKLAGEYLKEACLIQESAEEAFAEAELMKAASIRVLLQSNAIEEGDVEKVASMTSENFK